MENWWKLGFGSHWFSFTIHRTFGTSIYISNLLRSIKLGVLLWKWFACPKFVAIFGIVREKMMAKRWNLVCSIFDHHGNPLVPWGTNIVATGHKHRPWRFLLWGYNLQKYGNWKPASVQPQSQLELGHFPSRTTFGCQRVSLNVGMYVHKTGSKLTVRTCPLQHPHTSGRKKELSTSESIRTFHPAVRLCKTWNPHGSTVGYSRIDGQVCQVCSTRMASKRTDHEIVEWWFSWCLMMVNDV